MRDVISSLCIFLQVKEKKKQLKKEGKSILVDEDDPEVARFTQGQHDFNATLQRDFNPTSTRLVDPTFNERGSDLDPRHCLFKQAVYKQTMKLFAELEIKRKERETKEMHERKRQREEEIEAEEKAKRDREWQRNFEVQFWRKFNGIYTCFFFS
ncbi:hypothetical protein AB205_0175530 [Aquarana catesbeiana]|uniref:Uncharacterized protein n=1 Tax=Aquarana catesbeiana TaxID=8400 RepID=A0A2G9NAS2_AQUCT|nr:hypothetical protein AB205_0175530 [Aquarana catesbeiana]